jgi:hypothetical protein
MQTVAKEASLLQQPVPQQSKTVLSKFLGTPPLEQATMLFTAL